METNRAKKLIGYTRVSKENKNGIGVSLEEQASWLVAETQRRGAELEIVSEGDGVSGRKLSNRPALLETLRRLDRGEADGLLVKKLDRLARNVADFLTILERSRKGKWALIIGDLDIDTSTPLGEAMATVGATFAQLERARISERTKDALAHKRKQGVRLGRPATLPKEIVLEIVKLRKEGKTLQAIADTLNARGVENAHKGAKWYPSTIRYTLERAS
jgi:DNA invertase Pin-like site-specific DNA recombinase